MGLLISELPRRGTEFRTVSIIKAANEVILGTTPSNFSILGYVGAVVKDVTGIFAPIVSQVEYVIQTLFKSEKKKLSELRGASSDAGKAFHFSQLMTIATQATSYQEAAFVLAEQELTKFFTEDMPMALDELGV